MDRVLDIGSRREVFWDDYLIDPACTTVSRKMHHPVRRELVMKCDKPWEGDNCYFFSILRDTDRYRIYYCARNTPELYAEETPDAARRMFRICYAESTDGLLWEKPSLGICSFNGSTDNNIICDIDMDDWHDPRMVGDGLHVIRDTNPACLPEERYKGIYGAWIHDPQDGWYGHTLKCMVSPDGIHFRPAGALYRQRPFFDSLNTFFYDEERGKYICYFRGWHSSDNLPVNQGIPECRDRTRDIRRMESADFVNWSEPELIEFGEDSPDFHQYINNIQPYPRAPHLLVGFPARYVERNVWTANYDRLCGREDRLARMKVEPRFGTTVTDGMFIFSRDSYRFERESEAFLRPGPESDWTWTYGDGFAAAGLLELPSDFAGADPELALLVPHHRWIPDGEGVWLYRYAIRADGFFSRSAGYLPQTLVTKPFIFRGNTLRLNFETSAVGYVRVELLDKIRRPIEGYTSCEIFGNSTDRVIDFPGDIAKLEGRPVRLRLTMSDADVYSFRFAQEREHRT